MVGWRYNHSDAHSICSLFNIAHIPQYLWNGSLMPRNRWFTRCDEFKKRAFAAIRRQVDAIAGQDSGQSQIIQTTESSPAIKLLSLAI